MAIKFTVVQHSGYGYGGDSQFRRGLEPRQLTTAKEQDLVEKAGGLVFNSYGDADAFAMEEMYPSDGFFLTPKAAGTFAEAKIDELRIYVPPTKEDSNA